MELYSLPIWLLLLLLSLLFLFKNKIASKTQKHLPPSPPKLPILGNLHQLGALPHRSFSQLSRKYGPVMLLHFGRVPVLIISSAEAAKEVLKVHDLECCSRPLLAGSGKLSYNYSDVAFSPYGESWRQMRKISVLEVFSLRRVQSHRFIREQAVAVLINAVSQSASAGTAIDLNEKLYALTASIIFSMAFGRSFQGSDFDRDKFHILVDEIEIIMGRFSAEECFPYVGWILDRINGHHTRIDRVFRELDACFEQVIKDHLKPDRANQKEDVIDVLLNIEREQIESGGAWLTKNNIKGVLLNLFLGGIDTGALTVNWAMSELIKNPRVMKKAQDEVRNCMGKKENINESDIEQLQYLKMVIKETLRLHPPAPLLLPREALSHFKINGYDIDPKTLIRVNAWAIGRDPNYWKNPEEFFPERFIDHPVDFRGQNFEYLPFGAGRRICPGIHMGTTTVELALANLLYGFDWKLPDGWKGEDINMEEALGASLTVSKKIPLSLVPISYFQ